MHCPQCGKDIAADTLFCPHCGKSQKSEKDSNAADLSLVRETKALKTRLEALERSQETAEKYLFSPPARKIKGFQITLFSALLALFAFCFLPYIAFLTHPDYGYVVPNGGQWSNSTTVTGVIMLNSDAVGKYKIFAIPSLWMQPAVAMLLAAGALYQIIKVVYARHTGEDAEWRHHGAFSLTALAILAALCIFLQAFMPIDDTRFFAYAGIGYWLFIIALVLAAVGGIVQMVTDR